MNTFILFEETGFPYSELQVSSDRKTAQMSTQVDNISRKLTFQTSLV